MARCGTGASCKTALRQPTCKVCADMGRSSATLYSRMVAYRVDDLLNALLDSA